MKKALAAVSIAAIAASLAGCGSASTSGSESSREGETVKIAIIPPTSGALAQFGSDARAGWELAVELINADGGVDGRQVELVVKDTDADPATTLRMAREAVTKDGAKFIGAVMTSPENAALNAQLEGLGALSINTLGKDDALIGEQCVPNAFHISHTPTMDINGIAESLADIPGDKWAIQAVDYSTGHNTAATFEAAARKAGKEIVLKQFAPLNTTDFGTYITQIRNSGADAVFAVVFGADAIAFVKQAAQFNLSKQVKTVLGLNMVAENVFEALGDAIVGYYNNVEYDPALENDSNRRFVKAYTEKTGSAPYYVPADAYLGAQLLFQAIEDAGSAEPVDVREALAGITAETIVGEVAIRSEDQQLMRPTYVGKVVKGDSGLRFEIISDATPEENIPEPSADCKL